MVAMVMIVIVVVMVVMMMVRFARLIVRGGLTAVTCSDVALAIRTVQVKADVGDLIVITVRRLDPGAAATCRRRRLGFLLVIVTNLNVRRHVLQQQK
jgi:hypothetical protein